MKNGGVINENVVFAAEVEWSGPIGYCITGNQARSILRSSTREFENIQ